jgi:hypothetical protein
MKHLCPRCKSRNLVRNGKTPGGKVRWSCVDQSGDRPTQCYSTTDPTAPVRGQNGNTKVAGAPAIFKRTLKGVKRVIVTAAQNATPVHPGFLKNLELAANDLDAELAVIPLRYKNATSTWTASQENAETWDAPVVRYLCNQRKQLNKNLVLLGDIKTQPTATQPLTGFDAMTHGESAILGHTKLQLRTVPTPQSRFAKLLTTTGACTVPNYTDSKAGKLGEFHHTLGATLVEMQGGKFHMRQINADKSDGSFIDLTNHYGADYAEGGIGRGLRCQALVMGDTHVDFIDPAVKKATFGKGGMIDVLKPRHLVWHDLLDGYSKNPHHAGNPFNALAKLQSGKDNVKAEVMRALEFVDAHTPKDCQSVIVASNHDDFLRRWIVNSDWRSDPLNAAFYLECALAMVRGTKMGTGGTEYPSPFAMLARQYLPNAKVLGGRESFTVDGIELGMHGDRGPNGARGSIRNLRRIGVKSMIGHGHAPGIDEGCMQVGTSTHLRLEYNEGVSGWMNSHGAIYANGKRSLLHIVDGDWRL